MDDNKKKYQMAINSLNVIKGELEELNLLCDDCLLTMKKCIIVDSKTINEDLLNNLIKENNYIRNEIINDVLISLKEKI